tara:strand:+ start:816 stop:938 length:123 start_codon:yes stop_codon:yes gene_type:complete
VAHLQQFGTLALDRIDRNFVLWHFGTLTVNPLHKKIGHNF